MNQQVRLEHFLEGGAERGHQLVRQVGDEADRVGEDHLAARGQPQFAHGRIQRREQLVARRDTGAGERIEQGRFAGVGIPHQGHHGIRHPAPRGAVQFARAPHGLDVALQLDDAIADEPAIRLDLGFAGTAEEAEAAALPLEVGPGPHQARPLIGERGQFDLQRALLGPGTGAENLENQPGAVDYLGAPRFFQIALLYRRQAAVDDGQRDLVFLAERAETIDRPPSQQGGRCRAPQRHRLPRHDVEIDGLREADGLGQPTSGQARILVASRHRMDHKRTGPGTAICARRRDAVDLRRRHASSSPSLTGGSNREIEVPGITVEMACL